MNDIQKMKLSAGQLAKKLDAELVGDAEVFVSGVNGFEAASDSEITFLKNSLQVSKIIASNACGFITEKHLEDIPKLQFIVENVDLALIKTLNIFARKFETEFINKGIHPSAVIAKDAMIGENVSIGPNSTIEAGVKIAQNVVIGANCFIGPCTIIGKNTSLDSNVVVYRDCKIGQNVIIQANTTIGSTGFGYYFVQGQHQLIPHNGSVIIEDCVEIGANSCVDRAKFGNTVIGAGTKIDNLVQIAHNVTIGKLCLIASVSGVAGSSVLGDGVVLAGSAGIGDHVTVGAGTQMAARSLATRDIAPGMKVMGKPAKEMRTELRRIALNAKLPELFAQVKELNKRIEKLETTEDNSQ